MSFDVERTSTPLNIYNHGPQTIDTIQPSIPAQLMPQHLFSVQQVDRAGDHGSEIPPSLISQGISTGKQRRTVLWEQEIPIEDRRSAVQQKHRHRSVRVESLYYVKQNGSYYWKIYIEHEYSLLTRDSNQFVYRSYRK